MTKLLLSLSHIVLHPTLRSYVATVRIAVLLTVVAPCAGFLICPLTYAQVGQFSDHGALGEGQIASDSFQVKSQEARESETPGDLKSSGSSSEVNPFPKNCQNVFVLPNATSGTARMFLAAGQALRFDRHSIGSEARIRIVIPSLTEVENKLKWLIELSPDPHLRKQWKRFKEDLIDAFTDGVDTKKPISVDIVFPAEELSYELRIPISDFSSESKGFLDGLRGRSYDVKSLGNDAYEIVAKGKKRSRVLFDQNYAWISTGDRPVPVKPRLATLDLMPLLALKKDLVGEIKNNVEDAPIRRSRFHAFRAHLENGNRIRPSEGQNAFEMRKQFLKLMLDEAQRFLVEAEAVTVNWTVDNSARNRFGRGEISVTALPETDLLKSIEESATKPSHFANLTLHQNSFAFARFNAPLDATRVQSLKEFCDSMRPILESEIEARHSQRNDMQKGAYKRALNLFINMIDDAIELGSVDVHADLFASASNKNRLIWGLRVANGKIADEIVKLLPSFRPGWQVKLSAHESSGVEIHELTIAKRDLLTFQSVFEDESVIYIGTGQNVVWGAAGSESLKYLRTAIEQSNQPGPEKADAVVFSCRLQIGKLASLFGMFRKTLSSETAQLTLEQRRTKKDIDKYLKLADDAFAKCEPLIVGELRRANTRIEGYAELNECVLRFVGSILGDTAKDLH